MHGASIDEGNRDESSEPPGEVGREGTPADVDCPTTPRFSPRAGDAFCDVAYAAAVELPVRSKASDTTIAIVTVICALVGAVVEIPWQGQ